MRGALPRPETVIVPAFAALGPHLLLVQRTWIPQIPPIPPPWPTSAFIPLRDDLALPLPVFQPWALHRLVPVSLSMEAHHWAASRASPVPRRVSHL